jgi:hypothetical protein
MVTKNRQAKGSRSGKAILDEEQIVEILEGVKNKTFNSISQIGRMYNVNGLTISSIFDGNSWVDVTKDFDLKSLKDMLINGKSTITNEIVLEIDNLLKIGEPVYKISETYQVSTKIIYDIKYRNTHKKILK